MTRILFIFLGFGTCGSVFSQIGLQLNTADNIGGYILFQPNNYNTTFLIDRQGYVVKEWPGDYNPGRGIYLLEDGTLLRTSRLENDAFNDGGRGGRIEMVSQTSQIQWYFELSDENQTLHHDIAHMPNGNILALAWERMSKEDADLNGRDPNLVQSDEIWMEVILELEPTTPGNANIVWEWHLKDHLIQDFDNTKLNFSSISDNINRLDINYIVEDTAEDWIHLNAIDYNSELDQIVLSTPFLNEIWIIDHSTTTEEARTSMGGNSNMGGDFLFRWGNNNAFGVGEASDRQLFGQHNPNWILEDNQWKILLFNNGKNREISYSSVEKVEPVYNEIGSSYTVQSGTFLPSSAVEIYTAPDKTDFFSSFVSSAQKLTNQAYLICSGATGRIFEIDETKELSWEYVNPVNLEFGCVDDNPNANGGILFRATHVAEDFSGLQGLELSQKYLLEEAGCDQIPLSLKERVELRLSKKSDYIQLDFDSEIVDLAIHTIDGKNISYSQLDQNQYLMKKIKGVFIISGTARNKTPFTKKVYVQ